LKLDLQKKYNLANSAFYLRPSFSEGFNNRTEELKNQLLTVRSKLKNFRLPIREGIALIRDLNMVSQIVQYKTGMLSKHRLTDCMFVTEQRPSISSKVELTDELNEYENYKTKVSWRVSDQDIQEVLGLKTFISRNLMALNAATETYDSDEFDWRDRLASAAHHLGTVRMSEDASSGCVDSNLKLHGFEGIYVCDGSVFTTSGNANPTMTCMALGSRLGELLSSA
jgi:choline dehydrogenase-like flavoprotein